ncbi:cation transporter [Methanocaldococcus infernus ME]|uniref:Cation transporter n=1 Tax=Methanocaldococcus infernus (strain DSM 11812 / JCM 15783 / ME) TaxID=573063 RepID=D5VT52_METIM|nr:potassium transporter TrkG [Methanocaldococcus infernus]ADG13755.1 cation transporter [Methanocaldococcus infernus ME]
MITYKDISTILNILGRISLIISLISLIPIFVAFYFKENPFPFIISSLLSFLISLILLKTTKIYKVKLYHCMCVSSLSWILASLIGAIPFYLSIPYFSYLDGVYESASAWTTTGMSLIIDLNVVDKSILFWRSLEQWIGGVGILVFSSLVLSNLASHLYLSEARQEKILPKFLSTIKTIIWIYIFYTIVGILLLYLSGLSPWESLNLTMTGICTGGMSLSNESFPYNSLAKLFMILIMLAGGVVSFSTHYKILSGKLKLDCQIKYSLLVILLSSLFICFKDKINFLDSLFLVTSALTSTGFSTFDLSKLSEPSLILLIFIMFIGGGTGTTTGGVKILRFLIILKIVYYEIKKIVYPRNTVFPKYLSNLKLDDKIVKEAFTIFILYLFSSFTLFFIFSFYTSPLKALFDSVSFVSNIGLSLEVVNINSPAILKIAGIFGMILGRLEIIPILILILTFSKIKRI